MPRRTSIVGPAGALSRKRTAEMLRKLRTLNSQVKMLKARLDEEGQAERRRRTLRSRPKH